MTLIIVFRELFSAVLAAGSRPGGREQDHDLPALAGQARTGAGWLRSRMRPPWRIRPQLAGNIGMRGNPAEDDDQVTRDLGHAISQLSRPDMGWTGRAVLSGHARVLATGGFALGTPLYIEYAADPER